MESDNALKISEMQANIVSMKEQKDKEHAEFNEQITTLKADYQNLKADDELKLK